MAVSTADVKLPILGQLIDPKYKQNRELVLGESVGRMLLGFQDFILHPEFTLKKK